jgi:hypothetical protein
VKPISEWTDDELRDLIARPGRATWPQDFPAEVLRLRAMQVRHNSEMEAYCRYQREATARAEKAEADAAYGRAARVADWQARSLAAEAEIEEWKRIVRGWEQTHEQHRRAVGFPTNELIDRMRKAEAALARVRALCDAAAVWTEQGYGWTTVDEIRAAIEGEH